jgi:hypothetical protein
MSENTVPADADPDDPRKPQSPTELTKSSGNTSTLHAARRN